jgi:ribosomal protein S18 acetylase RimI-like enzyme
MRRPVFQTPSSVAIDLFARAHHVHLSSTLPDGTPVEKTVHGVVDDGALCFHAAPIGEKMLMVDRPAVASAVEVVAQIPSYFTDPARACPATTLYRSAQALGAITEIHDPERKARVLSLLMQRFQPEGGFVPIAANDRLYKKAILGIFVGALSLDRAVGKAKLMQNKSPADRANVLEALFRRGAPGDTAAIESIREANPEDPPPEFLRGPGGSSFSVAPDRTDAEQAAQLVMGTYWNRVDGVQLAGRSPGRSDEGAPTSEAGGHESNAIFDHDELVRAHLGSNAWVVLRAESGDVVASARAITDGVKHAWVYDVIVAPERRRSEVGTALMRLLLDHPAARGARFVHLGTKDAQRFYARLGFVESASIERPYTSTSMTLVRAQKKPSEARLHTASPD